MCLYWAATFELRRFGFGLIRPRHAEALTLLP